MAGAVGQTKRATGGDATRERELGMSFGLRLASLIKVLVATKPMLVLSMPQSCEGGMSASHWAGKTGDSRDIKLTTKLTDRINSTTASSLALMRWSRRFSSSVRGA